MEIDYVIFHIRRSSEKYRNIWGSFCVLCHASLRRLDWPTYVTSVAAPPDGNRCDAIVSGQSAQAGDV